MGTLHGIGGLLYLQGSGDNATKVGEAKTWRLNVDREAADDTAMGDSWTTQKHGILKWSGNITGNFDTAETSPFDAGTATSQKQVFLYPDKDNLSRNYYGVIWPKLTVEVDKSGIASFNLDFDGDSTLLSTTVEATVSITPSLGGEEVTNGNMETGSPPSSWIAVDSTLSSDADERTGGAGVACLGVTNVGANYGQARQTTGAVSAGWYSFSGWTETKTATILIEVFVSGVLYWTVSGGSDAADTWYNKTGIFRAAAGGVAIWLEATPATNGLLARFDDISLKMFTLSSLLALAGDPGVREGLFDAHPTLTADTQCGIAIGVDDETNPLYGVFAYHDGTNAVLEKLVNGTWTTLIDAAAAYVAGARLLVKVVGNTWQLFYNGSQVGTDQTIDTSSGYGTKLCGFSTYASNSVGTVSAVTA